MKDSQKAPFFIFCPVSQMLILEKGKKKPSCWIACPGPRDKAISPPPPVYDENLFPVHTELSFFLTDFLILMLCTLPVSKTHSTIRKYSTSANNRCN